MATGAKAPSTERYRVQGVGVIYQKPQPTLSPETGEVVYTVAPTLATRGEEIDLIEFEARRLAALGAVKLASEEKALDELDDDELQSRVKAIGLEVRGSAVDGSVRRDDLVNALTVYEAGLQTGAASGVIGTTTVPGGIAESHPGSSETPPTQTGAAPGGAPDPLDTETEDLATYIRQGPGGRRLNAEETVALARGDAERAEKVLEAERVATGGDARQTVEARLQGIIDAAEEAEEE